MRLKTYCAGSMAEAMHLVRKDMGRDAIIVATHQEKPGSEVQITAALEADDRDDAPFAGWGSPDADDAGGGDNPGATGEVQPGSLLHRDLGYHGVPAALSDRLVRLGASFTTADPIMSLAGALDEAFAFAPLADRPPPRPVMLVGPPGAGKTIVAAKLMMRARRAGRPFAAITTDTRRAGGIEQLQAFTDILGAELATADDADALATAVQTAQAGELYIDTGGVNPYDDDELESLRGLVRAARAEPFLVLPAGGDAMEAADIARAFASVGARRLIATRLDMARRFGSLLTAAAAGQLSFADVGISPFVTDGLVAVNPVSLARVMLPVAGVAAPDAAERPLAKEAGR